MAAGAQVAPTHPDMLTFDESRRIAVPALPAAWRLRTADLTVQARRPTKFRRRRSIEGKLLLS